MKAKDLKNSILQMAVQGKLVPQDPNDEPASVLLERIRKERAELIAEKKIKFPKDGESVIYRASDGSHYEKRIDAKGHVLSDECIENEIPFEIPESWEWVRLENITTLLSGTDLSSTEYNDKHDGIPYITGASNFDNGNIIENRWTSIPKRISHEGDLLFTCKGTVGEMAFNPFKKAHIARQVMAIIPNQPATLPYIGLYLSAMLEKIKTEAKGVIPGIERVTVLRAFLPFPPLAEQHRIVERVEELMPLVNKYGVLEESREALDSELPERLRKSVLQQAVQGKLVPQDPSDEPASVLLKRIREERTKLFAEKKVKFPRGGESVIYRASDGGYYEKRIDAKGHVLNDECIDDEIPFEIPDSWEWARLGSLARLIGGFAFKSENYVTNGTRVIRISDFNESGFVNNKIVRYRYTNDLEQYLLEENDILICMTGGTVGKSLQVKTLPEPLLVNQRVAAVRAKEIANYLNFAIKSDLFLRMVADNKNSTNDNISMSDISSFLLPLPPLAEQQRIVDRYNQLSMLL